MRIRRGELLWRVGITKEMSVVNARGQFLTVLEFERNSKMCCLGKCLFIIIPLRIFLGLSSSISSREGIVAETSVSFFFQYD